MIDKIIKELEVINKIVGDKIEINIYTKEDYKESNEELERKLGIADRLSNDIIAHFMDELLKNRKNLRNYSDTMEDIEDYIHKDLRGLRRGYISDIQHCEIECIVWKDVMLAFAAASNNWDK